MRSNQIPHLNIVLVEPEIPPNTGNIARLCAATQSTLHLVHPLGFRLDERHLKRAGLDYWPHVSIVEHKNLDAFIEFSKGKDLFLYSTTGNHMYTKAQPSPDAFLVFGKETQGLPRDFISRYGDRSFFLPMWGKVRSLNLSSSVAIVVYDAYSKLFNWGTQRPYNNKLHA